MKVSELIAMLQPYVAKGDPTLIWLPCKEDEELGCDLATGPITVDDFEGCSSDGYTLALQLPSE